MEDGKFIGLLSKRVDDLSRSQAIAYNNNNINNAILADTVIKQSKSIKTLKTQVAILGVCMAISSILYLSHELIQDEKLENLHKSGSKMCPKMCILHKFENENKDIFDVDDLK